MEKQLTKAEKDVLYLLFSEFLTPKKIAIRRKTSTQAIYKLIKKLRKKGLITGHYRQVAKNECTLQPPNQIRLHGHEFHINILYKDNRYKEIMEKSNTLISDGNTIRLFRNSIELYMIKSFYGDDVDKATSKAIYYLNRFLGILENDLKVILVKSRSQNIKLVKFHYAETNNELATECEKAGDKIRIYATEDCKLWFTIDNSFNWHESETQHPETGKHDMAEVVRPFFNDLRNNRPPNLSEIMKAMREVININKDTASGLNAITNYLKSQLPTESNDKPIKDKADYFG